jgi:osmotically-inducible protein OsmY
LIYSISKNYLNIKRYAVLKYIILIIGILNISGCSNGSLLLGSGIAANMILTEPRHVSAIGHDMLICYSLNQRLSQDNDFQSSRINVTSYDHTLLLTGQVPNNKLHKRALEYAKSISQVKKVFNQVDISARSTFWQRTQDKLLTFTIRTKVWMTSGIRSNHFKIKTENKTVFIMGKAKSEDAQQVASIAQQTTGVQKVIQLVDCV